jgi:tetratricopeptide (TPR) repeat protein
VAAPEVSVTDSGLSSDDDPFQEDDTSWPSLPANLSDSGEAPLLSYVAEGPGSEWAGLRMRLQADPRSADAHAAVRRAISLREDRIDFYQELVDTYPEEVYHYLSLARAYRAAGQEREAIPHYQRYLRSRLEAEALDELAEVYSLVGERYLAESSRQIAQSLRSKGGSCSSS